MIENGGEKRREGRRREDQSNYYDYSRVRNDKQEEMEGKR